MDMMTIWTEHEMRPILEKIRHRIDETAGTLDPQRIETYRFLRDIYGQIQATACNWFEYRAGVCGYDLEDLLETAKIMRVHGVTPWDLIDWVREQRAKEAMEDIPVPPDDLMERRGAKYYKEEG